VVLAGIAVTGMTSGAIHFDQVRLPDSAQALRREVRAFLRHDRRRKPNFPRAYVTKSGSTGDCFVAATDQPFVAQAAPVHF